MATVSAGDAQACQAALADTDKFLRNEVVGWISSLEVVGSSLPEALDVALARLGKTPEDMVQPQPQPLAGPAGALWR